MKTDKLSLTLPVFSNDDQPIEARCCFVFHGYVSMLQGHLDERIHTAIHMTAEEMNLSSLYVSKTLVEHGLKASQNAFPNEFVHFIRDKSRLDPWAAGAMTYAQNKLAKLWQIQSQQPYYIHPCQSHSAGSYLQQ
jgi:hypothetical protein